MKRARGDRRLLNESAAADRRLLKARAKSNGESHGSWIEDNRSIYENTCYPMKCSNCKNNPTMCPIADETRMVDKFGKNWHQYYAQYREE